MSAAGVSGSETIVINKKKLTNGKEKSNRIEASGVSFKVDVKYPAQSIRWRSAFVHTYITVTGVIGAYYALRYAQWGTLAWAYVVYVMGMLGATVGHHRLWSHRTFKATTPLRIILMLFTCVAMQNDVWHWALEHRCHHKWTDTDADPHNSKRGLFYSHWGWLWLHPHPDQQKKAETIDISDLKADPVLQFQHKWYWPLAFTCCYIVPVLVPVYLWGEDVYISWWSTAMRYMLSLHLTWLINSIAHVFGDKPYDSSVSAVQNPLCSIATLGEGWHNYHHTFPQDYKTSEIPYLFNFSTVFIDFFAWLGWAYDLKQTSTETIERAKAKQLLKLQQNLADAEVEHDY